MKEAFGKAALEEIKALHNTSPKYQYKASTREDSLKKFSVDVLKFEATYVNSSSDKKAVVLSEGQSVFVEVYVKRHFESLGARVLEVESVPFHVLFGTFLYLLIQDPADPYLKTSSFGDRDAFENGEPGPSITTFLPSDFGTYGYGQRRAEEIKAFFAELPRERDELIWQFDNRLSFSDPFRQYLWGHRSKDIETARTLLEVLPGEAVHRILRYLVDSYWDRYIGWPDLLVVHQRDFRFVEVKSSKDKLSEEQERWIKDNHDILGFAYSIAKVHRA